ncbi:uncharacterized protein B0J16DRAFT_166895 [Fusarium flagelliforme]|uniref:uncharacterized protein n=1 Tax=Fusarium flagelliforme TaxID=2675880 RepID=UPI001E8CE103|nr:uncharacterized protein B0J16DRAFT_166895 [Fusarium flagelliforme]KAH7179127.1 hypothetical protein B0J16DRAFT_166895 [Fusarium flagelliforme]
MLATSISAKQVTTVFPGGWFLRRELFCLHTLDWQSFDHFSRNTTLDRTTLSQRLISSSSNIQSYATTKFSTPSSQRRQTPAMSETTAAQREVMRLEVQFEESTQRRQTTRDRLEIIQRDLRAAERQLEMDDQQVEIDSLKLEAARAEARFEELRRSANEPAPSATVTAEGTATTEAVGGLSRDGHHDRHHLDQNSARVAMDGQGSRRSSTNTVGMSGHGTYGGVSRPPTGRYRYYTTPGRVFGSTNRAEDLEEVWQRATQDLGTDELEVVLQAWDADGNAIGDKVVKRY